MPDWIKPDITAPGVNILAGATPEPNDGSFGGFFQYLSGTSMSTPHIAGLAALILEAHRSWTPAMVRSAMMTTARQNVVKEDGVTQADPFDFGSGHVDATRRLIRASCTTPGHSSISRELRHGRTAGGSGDCDFLEGLGYSLDPSDLNLPNIGIADLAGTQTVRRNVTNVNDKWSRYTVS